MYRHNIRQATSKDEGRQAKGEMREKTVNEVLFSFALEKNGEMREEWRGEEEERRREGVPYPP